MMKDGFYIKEKGKIVHVSLHQECINLVRERENKAMQEYVVHMLFDFKKIDFDKCALCELTMEEEPKFNLFNYLLDTFCNCFSDKNIC